ncbi:hypothetical protein NL676_018016 [Syzygium grande]|nr:hypothetical protein NL676_018016 [Syzygium grande]
MEVLFGFQELTEIIEEGFVEPEAAADSTTEEQRTIKENHKKDQDVLGKFEARTLRRQASSTEHMTLKRKVCYLSLWISNFIFHFKMAHNMKELRKRLDGINQEKTQLNLSSDVYDKTIVTRRETHSFVFPSNVIGKNEEKEMIIKLLRRLDDGRAGMIEIIPILRIEGIGKTTLAQLVYNDD